MDTNTGNIIWVNGRFIHEPEGFITPATHGLHYGTGLFEGIRTHRQVNGGWKIFRLKDHLMRFHDSARQLGLEIPYSPDELAVACEELLDQSGLQDAYLRPIAFTDCHFQHMAKATAEAKVVLMAIPFSSQPRGMCVPVGTAIVSEYRRASANVPFHRAKLTGHYSLISIAASEARSRGCNQALFLDERDRLCEALTDNVFLVVNGQVITPSDSAPILKGITRGTVIDLLARENVHVIERDVSLAEVYNAEEIFTTSTAGGVKSLIALDGQLIGTGAPGAITQLASSLYEDCVGGVIEH